MGRAIITKRFRDNKPGRIEAAIQRWMGKNDEYDVVSATPLDLGAAPSNAGSALINLTDTTPNVGSTPDDDNNDTILDVFSKYQPNEAMTLYVLITSYLDNDTNTTELWVAYGLCQLLAPILHAAAAGHKGEDSQYYQLFGTSVYFCCWAITLGGPFLTLSSYDRLRKIITAFVIPILSTLLTVYKDQIDDIFGNSCNKKDCNLSPTCTEQRQLINQST